MGTSGGVSDGTVARRHRLREQRPLGFTILYELDGGPHAYPPDFLVRLAHGTIHILEIKADEDEPARAKHQAARRWVAAVNHWGKLGRWAFHVSQDPQMSAAELESFWVPTGPGGGG